MRISKNNIAAGSSAKPDDLELSETEAMNNNMYHMSNRQGNILQKNKAKLLANIALT